jgi:hypothetical protein
VITYGLATGFAMPQFNTRAFRILQLTHSSGLQVRSNKNVQLRQRMQTTRQQSKLGWNSLRLRLRQQSCQHFDSRDFDVSGPMELVTTVKTKRGRRAQAA